MEATDWIAFLGTLATTTIAAVALWRNHRQHREQQRREDDLHRLQQEREDRIRSDQQAREDSLREIKRETKPQVEFTVDCRFFGADQGNHLAEIHLRAHNKGQVIQRFSTIQVRVRGIERDKPFGYWEGHGKRAEFPIELVKEPNIIPQPQDGSYVTTYFAEPGILQVFTYVTLIPIGIGHIVVYAEFDYATEVGRTHNCERVFAMPEVGTSKPVE